MIFTIAFSVDESEKPADTEEMLIAKRTLVLNLEKFLRMRKEEIRAKTEGNFEAQRLTLLRRPKTVNIIFGYYNLVFYFEAKITGI